jgi:type I restriction enzyme M protein
VKAKQGDISCINVYGQEKEAATYRLAKMNLALRGISHNLGAESDSTFTNDLHKGIYFDYIMANPPFNLKGWYNDNLKNDPRWTDYATPPESNANYAWILHMLSHLKPLTGVAGFLLANGALGDTDALEIRKKLIENDKVEAILILPQNLFYSTNISVTLWILNNNKKARVVTKNGKEIHLRDREKEILFMDLRKMGIPFEKKYIELDQNTRDKVTQTYHNWQQVGYEDSYKDEPEYCFSSQLIEIENKGWSLVPSKYIEFRNRDNQIDFDSTMRQLQEDLRIILQKESESTEKLKSLFESLGYGI